MLIRSGAASLAIALSALPAHAHPGSHAHLGLLETIQHYAEPDHLAFLALTVFVAWVAFRVGRRAEARAQRASESRKQGRS
jgi:hypothetical protein